MKKILLSVLAVAALASCVEDLGAGDAIDFGAPFVGNTTKAADPSYGEDGVDLTEFKVYGTVQGTGAGVVNIFNGVEVTGDVGQDNWKYAEAHNQYWIPGAIYNFAAVVDAASVGQNAAKMPINLTPAKNGDYYKDMLYAFNGPITAAATAPYDKVDFAFEHLLAKAQFVVTSTTEGGYYYNVKGIKIQNIHTGAVYTIGGTKVDGKDNGYWDGDLSNSVEDWFSLGDILNVTAANNNQTNTTQVLLIPTTDEFNVEFVVELRNDMGTTADTSDDALLREIHYTAETKDACGCNNANAEHKKPITVKTGLVKGHAYNFNLALTAGSLIEFTVTNNPAWATPSDNVNLGL